MAIYNSNLHYIYILKKIIYLLSMFENILEFYYSYTQLTWNLMGCLQSSQNSFLLCLIHCMRHSWWMYRILPIHLHGWKSGRPGEDITSYKLAYYLRYIVHYVLTVRYIKVRLSSTIDENDRCLYDFKMMRLYIVVCSNITDFRWGHFWSAL